MRVQVPSNYLNLCMYALFSKKMFENCIHYLKSSWVCLDRATRMIIFLSQKIKILMFFVVKMLCLIKSNCLFLKGLDGMRQSGRFCVFYECLKFTKPAKPF